jgi:hypothetical protein
LVLDDDEEGLEDEEDDDDDEDLDDEDVGLDAVYKEHLEVLTIMLNVEEPKTSSWLEYWVLYNVGARNIIGACSSVVG